MSEIVKTGVRKLQAVNWGFFGLVGVWLMLAIFVGLAAVILPYQYMLVLGAIPAAVVLAAGYPAAALFGVLILAFGLLPQFIFGTLPLGSASLQPAEMLLILLFLILLIREQGIWARVASQIAFLWVPFAFLAIGLLFAFYKGSLLAHNRFAGADLRQYVGWLSLPVAVWLTNKSSSIIHRLMMIIATISAIAMVLQMVFGVQLIYGFRGAEELSKEFSDVKRSAIGGGEVFLIYGVYYLFATLCDHEKVKFRSVILLMMLVGGLVASFSRGVWAGLFVGGVVFLFMLPTLRRNKISIVLLAAICSLFFVGLIALAVPRVGDAIAERVLSVEKEGGKGSSLGFRFDENQQALAAIRGAPILGNGFGYEYKTVFRQGAIGGGFDSEVSFVHNAYLGIWMKLGIFGLMFMLLFIFALKKKVSVRSYFDGTDSGCLRDRRIAAIAAFSSIVSYSVSGFSAPIWTTFITIIASSCLVAVIVAADVVVD